MLYKLGKFMYKNGAIYIKKLFFYHKIAHGPYCQRVGIKKVNRLCGIIEPEPDHSYLTPVLFDENIEGVYLVNFKNPDGYFGNDPMVANISKHYQKDGRLYIKWINGRDAVIYPRHINVWKLT